VCADQKTALVTTKRWYSWGARVRRRRRANRLTTAVAARQSLEL